MQPCARSVHEIPLRRIHGSRSDLQGFDRENPVMKSSATKSKIKYHVSDALPRFPTARIYISEPGKISSVQLLFDQAPSGGNNKAGNFNCLGLCIYRGFIPRGRFLVSCKLLRRFRVYAVFTVRMIACSGEINLVAVSREQKLPDRLAVRRARLLVNRAWRIEFVSSPR